MYRIWYFVKVFICRRLCGVPRVCFKVIFRFFVFSLKHEKTKIHSAFLEILLYSVAESNRKIAFY